MKLTKKQIKEIKKLIPYFEKIKDEEINQEIGDTDYYKTPEDLRAGFEKEAKECGHCFGVHLARFYGHDTEKIVNYKTTPVPFYFFCYTSGREEFLKRMGFDFKSRLFHDKAKKFYELMWDCGSHAWPFSEYKWHLHPAEVLKNMLKKGA